MPHEPSDVCRKNASGALAFAIEDTRARLAAIRGSGGLYAASSFAAECEALRDHAAASGLLCRCEILNSPPDTRGYEHEVWFPGDSDSPRVIKATYPDAFGHLPDGRESTPVEYLVRLTLQNQVFGDDIRLECVHWDGDIEGLYSLRIVTSQPAVRGRPASLDEITDLFVSNGFVPIQLKGRNGWFRELDDMVCSDTHGGNILIQADGTAAAIDVPVMKLEDRLKIPRSVSDVFHRESAIPSTQSPDQISMKSVPLNSM